MSTLKLEFEVPEDFREGALKFFSIEAKYLILLAEDGASKVVVLK